ncbi:MAG: hypothetical protein RLZZ450_2224 [Pseudomonadota bacterium]|jgi:predicted RNase H-like HicB family nuclease
MGKSYRVRYEKDEDGMWVAVIDRSQGASCVAQGRSIGEARKRIRGALAVYIGDAKAAAAAVLVDEPVLPALAKRAVIAAAKERDRAKKAQADAQSAASAAAVALTKAGLSSRDAAELLGISHQRVHQLAGGAPAASARAEKRRAGTRPRRNIAKAG